jgi:hypothetical protein
MQLPVFAWFIWLDVFQASKQYKGLANILSLGSYAFVVRCLLILASMDAEFVAIYHFAAGGVSP